MTEKTGSELLENYHLEQTLVVQTICPSMEGIRRPFYATRSMKLHSVWITQTCDRLQTPYIVIHNAIID